MVEVGDDDEFIDAIAARRGLAYNRSWEVQISGRREIYYSTVEAGQDL